MILGGPPDILARILDIFFEVHNCRHQEQISFSFPFMAKFAEVWHCPKKSYYSVCHTKKVSHTWTTMTKRILLRFYRDGMGDGPSDGLPPPFPMGRGWRAGHIDDDDDAMRRAVWMDGGWGG